MTAFTFKTLVSLILVITSATHLQSMKRQCDKQEQTEQSTKKQKLALSVLLKNAASEGNIQLVEQLLIENTTSIIVDAVSLLTADDDDALVENNIRKTEIAMTSKVAAIKLIFDVAINKKIDLSAISIGLRATLMYALHCTKHDIDNDNNLKNSLLLHPALGIDATLIFSDVDTDLETLNDIYSTMHLLLNKYHYLTSMNHCTTQTYYEYQFKQPIPNKDIIKNAQTNLLKFGKNLATLQEKTQVVLLKEYEKFEIITHNDHNTQQLSSLLETLLANARTYGQIYSYSKYEVDSILPVFDLYAKIYASILKKITPQQKQINQEQKTLGELFLAEYNVLQNNTAELNAYLSSNIVKETFRNEKQLAGFFNLVNEIKKHIKNSEKETIYVVIGQSMAYPFLMAQIILTLENDDNYKKIIFVPFSGSFYCKSCKKALEARKRSCEEHNHNLTNLNELQQTDKPTDEYIQYYQKYLKEDFGITEESSIVVCDLVEYGFGLKSFLGILPTKKYTLFVQTFLDRTANNGSMNKLLFDKEKIVYHETCKQTVDDLLETLTASSNARIRLIPKYPYQLWPFGNQVFIPDQEAFALVFKFIDYYTNQARNSSDTNSSATQFPDDTEPENTQLITSLFENTPCKTDEYECKQM